MYDQPFVVEAIFAVAETPSRFTSQCKGSALMTDAAWSTVRAATPPAICASVTHFTACLKLEVQLGAQSGAVEVIKAVCKRRLQSLNGCLRTRQTIRNVGTRGVSTILRIALRC